mgnify:CR=1 FL=1
MDFTEPKAIGKEIDADFAQLQMTGGYDHNFVLDKPEVPLTGWQKLIAKKPESLWKHIQIARLFSSMQQIS